MKPYMLIFVYHSNEYGDCQGVRFYDDYDEMKNDELRFKLAISIESEKVECYMRSETLSNVGYVRI